MICRVEVCDDAVDEAGLEGVLGSHWLVEQEDLVGLALSKVLDEGVS